MKKNCFLVLGTLGLFVTGCNNKNESPVVAERYIHKYGYPVSKEEWESRQYPGQVITTLTNGATITATYENGVLHGPYTQTYPHSQTIECYRMYNLGSPVKEIFYDIQGMPSKERVELSLTRYSTTLWYADGTPLSVEEYAGEELLEGEYFTTNNETEARVEKGNGLRIRRDQTGVLLSREQIEKGYPVKQETFYSNGSPQTISYFVMNKLHGEKRSFSASGEPLAVEEWLNGKLHGKSTYFTNGVKTLEVSYLNGLKNGLEVHYVDGNTVVQEIRWTDNKRHGLSQFYVDGLALTKWFYEDKEVSADEYRHKSRLDEMISQIPSEIRGNNR